MNEPQPRGRDPRDGGWHVHAFFGADMSILPARAACDSGCSNADAMTDPSLDMVRTADDMTICLNSLAE